MPSLGSMDYPDTSVPDAIEIAKKLAQAFRSNEFSKESLAAAMGYKNAKSGSYNQRAADLKKWGLIDGRGDHLRLTSLTHKLAAPGPGEFEQAVQSMLLNVPLFRSLHEHFEGEPPGDEDLFVTLLNLTAADRLAVKESLPKIRSFYMDAASRMGSRKTVGMGERSAARATVSDNDGGAPRAGSSSAPGAQVSLPVMPAGGDRYVMHGADWSLSVAMNEAALEQVKTLVDALLNIERMKKPRAPVEPQSVSAEEA